MCSRVTCEINKGRSKGYRRGRPEDKIRSYDVSKV